MRKRFTRGLLAGLLAASAIVAQQNQFQGSVAMGSVSATPLALTLHDAIDRGLKANLGLLVSDSTSESVRGQRLQALSALLPQLHAQGRRNDRTNQPENHRIQFHDSGSLHPHHRRPVSLHGRARLRILERFRLQRAQELSLGSGEQARRAALRGGCARPGGSGHGQRAIFRSSPTLRAWKPFALRWRRRRRSTTAPSISKTREPRPASTFCDPRWS